MSLVYLLLLPFAGSLVAALMPTHARTAAAVWSALVGLASAVWVALLYPTLADGRVLREVALRGSRPTNVAFGGADGRDVYVTLQDRGAIETFRSDRPGREAGR